MKEAYYKFVCSVCFGDDGTPCVLRANCSVVPNTCPFEAWGFNPSLQAEWEMDEDEQ